MLSCLLSCRHPSPDAPVIESGTPVTVTTIEKKYLNDTLLLYGTTQFLKKTTVTSPITGFIQSVNVATGDVITTGKVLFTIQTRESAAYPSTIADTLFKYSVIKVTANHSFQVDSVLKQPGDFVQEGEVLCQTTDPSTMIVRLRFPYEKKTLVKAGRNCVVLLPDGKFSAATVTKTLPSVDAVSQTQDAFVQIKSCEILPENLNVQVIFSDPSQSLSEVLPKDAILTDETMHEYWVMKMVNDSTAVKEVVFTGRKTKGEVEITSPVFSPQDKILVSGNYGLPDTAKVEVVK